MTPSCITIANRRLSGSCLGFSVVAGEISSLVFLVFRRIGLTCVVSGSAGVFRWHEDARASIQGSSYSFSLPTLPYTLITSGVILAYRGANTVLEAHILESVRDHPVVVPNLVTTVNGCTILRVGSVEPVNHERKLVSQDAMIARYDTGLTLYSTLYIGEELQASAGATGTRTLITQSDLSGRFDEGFAAFTLALCP
jgi:hypothetical protein